MSEWISWNGGTCPVKSECWVRVRFETPLGEEYESRASYASIWDWSKSGGIKAYLLDMEEIPSDRTR